VNRAHGEQPAHAHDGNGHHRHAGFDGDVGRAVLELAKAVGRAATFGKSSTDTPRSAIKRAPALMLLSEARGLE
jgi:hypothetical protein